MAWAIAGAMDDTHRIFLLVLPTIDDCEMSTDTTYHSLTWGQGRPEYRRGRS